MPTVTRIIQGKGIFLLTEEMRRSRKCVITTSVLQEPTNRSQNLRIQPNRAFYGWATVLAFDRVVRQHELLFPYEEILRFDNEVAYNLSYLYCCFRTVHEEVAQTVELPLGYISKPDFYESFYTELRFVLYTTTILEVTCNYETLSQICGSLNPQEQFREDPASNSPGSNFGDPKAPNPDASPSNPNPDGIGISTPYDSGTNDNGHSNFPPQTIYVILSFSGTANNQYNEEVPINTFDYESQHVIVPAVNAPFTVFQEFAFPGRPDLHAYTVRDRYDNGYTIGNYAWYGTPQLMVTPYNGG